MWVRVFVHDKFQSFIFKMLYRLDTPPCHITIQNLNKEPERSIQNNVYPKIQEFNISLTSALQTLNKKILLRF
jgi:hypothetical protein